MTKLLYLENTYNFQDKAHIIDIQTLDDGRTAMLLDKTIFYPQGGGQPCDIGVIRSDTAVFNVTDVRMDQEGNVLHMGTFAQGSFVKNDAVVLEIDKNRRIKNAKSHSAGHLIDCAVTILALPLKPTKGYHFPDGPNVEYEGSLDTFPEIIQKIQTVIDELVAKNNSVVIEDISTDQAAKQGLFVPVGKKARIVAFEGFQGCGCGGTHVGSAKEIGKIVIRKIKTKNGITKISYDIV